MKKISIAIMVLVVALASCKKTPEVNLKYVDVERDLITVGTTTATVQCDYQYIATLKKAYLCYGEGENEDNFSSAEMRVVQNTLYVDLAGLTANTTYNYYYEFHNGFNSMRTALKTFKTEGGSGPANILPTVVTGEVTEITTSSAKGSGEVTNDGGAEVTESGICWSINENPTLNDNHVAAGTGTGAFTAMMNGLEVGTTYHVRAYATNEVGTAYGLDREFTTLEECDCDYVDLGLPSGTLWATCNVGANSPEEYGDYFAWGETEPKALYSWSNYKYCTGLDFTMTKYCNIPLFGNNGFTDNLTTLEPVDDAATVNWGDEWRTPTYDEWVELYDYCVSVWTIRNNVKGLLFTAPNGNTIFLPAAGYRRDERDTQDRGYYWSNQLHPDYQNTARQFYFCSEYHEMNYYERFCGQTVRPVRKNDTPTPPGNVPEGAINGLFTINENGDKVYFSQGNLQYQASTNTWRFAEHQWDYVGTQTPDYNGYFGGTVNGSDNDGISQNYYGWIDLFSWGTSGYDHGSNCYQPWSTSFQLNDYHVYGGDTYNLFDQTGQADWGYNAISNGGNTENNGWRTLTGDEWNYLFNARNTLIGVRYAMATVNGVSGVVLLPDDWAASIFVLNDTNGGSYSNNIISDSDWTNILEVNGAVFFPAAGHRNQTSSNWFVSAIGKYGYYWSSSCNENNNACSMKIFENFLSFECGSPRSFGFSVRLVQDAN